MSVIDLREYFGPVILFFVVYLTTLLVSRLYSIVQCEVKLMISNWKYLEGSGCDLIEVLSRMD
jgi:hypothetical protein